MITGILKDGRGRMAELGERLAAVCDLMVADQREGVGDHRYDGVLPDLSPGAVAAGLTRIDAAEAEGPPLEDPHDEAHLAAFEDGLRWYLGEYQAHRRDPLL